MKTILFFAAASLTLAASVAWSVGPGDDAVVIRKERVSSV
jgi:hypothetical protein